MFKAGFINIIGKPNVGKSTLINAMIGEKVSIMSPKVQTTRHRIMGIINEEDAQFIFSDTPGIIDDPKYLLHSKMNRFIDTALEDGDVFIQLVEWQEPTEKILALYGKLSGRNVPVFVCINKIDQAKGQEEIVAKIDDLAVTIPRENIIPISALEKFNLEQIKVKVKEVLPENPAYFEEDIYTDKSERFLVSELIREKVFFTYQKEIPYSVEVICTSFKVGEDGIIRIASEIIVNKSSHKPIIIGKGGENLKRIGTKVRLELEEFYEQKVFLEVFVKVRENWRDNPNMLKSYGYDS